MKKILILSLAVILTQGVVMAQKAKKVQEKDVPERYVKDFHSKEKNQVEVAWTLVDSMVYDATFVKDNGTTQSYRFSPKGTETRWYIQERYYPHAIKDTVASLYSGHKITECYVLSIRNKTTYQVRIAKMKGFFRKRETGVKLLNFEIDGKYIDAIEVK